MREDRRRKTEGEEEEEREREREREREGGRVSEKGGGKKGE